MAEDRQISPGDRDRIKARFFSGLPPQTERHDNPRLATRLLLAFAECERPLVYCEGRFWCYAPEAGHFAPLDELELEDLALDLLPSARSPRALVAALRSRAFQGPGFFAPGKNALTCLDVTLVYDRCDPSEPIKPQDHSPGWRTRSRVPLTFLGGGDERRLQEFLSSTIPDTTARQGLLALVGLALVGEGTRFEKIVLLTGEGANGKSVLIDLLSSLFPPAQRTSVSPFELTTDFGRAKLDGSRLNTLSELGSLRPNELAVLKAVISGDVVNARRVGGNGFDLRPQALFIIASNELPQLGPRTEALARRIVHIRCPNIVPADKRDPFLKDKLREAAPALLRMCIDAANEALCRRSNDGDPFPMSERMEADGLLLHGLDPIERFLEQAAEITLNRSDRVSAPDLHQRLAEFCMANGALAPSKAHIRAALAKRGVDQVKSAGRFSYAGIRLMDAGHEGREGSALLHPSHSSANQPAASTP